MEKKQKIEGKVIRDAKGRILRLENCSESDIMIPFIDDVARSVEKFHDDTEKYSKRIEKLTVAMLILAIAQVLLVLFSLLILCDI